MARLLIEGKIVQLFKRIIQGPWLPPDQSNSAYAWLAMLLFFAWKYLEGSGGPTEIVLALCSLALFGLLYFSSFWLKKNASIFVSLALCALGLVWAPFNPGASVFIVFAAASCASIQPTKSGYAVLGLILALVIVEVFLLQLPSGFWVPALLVSSAIGPATIMQTALGRSRQTLLRSQEEVAHLATIAERERISRDLHDLLGHTLTLITIKAELAGKLLDRDPAACRKEIADIEVTAREALGEVRSAVSGYRKIGFTHELANAAACLSAANIVLTTSIANIGLHAGCENILTLSLREAVTNVVRHAQASQCEIALGAEDDWITLRITDNGKLAHNAVQPGNGLTGMRERIVAMGGQLILDTANGWSLHIRLPLPPRESTA